MMMSSRWWAVAHGQVANTAYFSVQTESNNHLTIYTSRCFSREPVRKWSTVNFYFQVVIHLEKSPILLPIRVDSNHTEVSSIPTRQPLLVVGEAVERTHWSYLKSSWIARISNQLNLASMNRLMPSPISRRTRYSQTPILTRNRPSIITHLLKHSHLTKIYR